MYCGYRYLFLKGVLVDILCGEVQLFTPGVFKVTLRRRTFWGVLWNSGRNLEMGIYTNVIYRGKLCGFELVANYKPDSQHATSGV